MPMEYYINSTELLECCAIKTPSLFKQERDLPCADVKGERSHAFDKSSGLFGRPLLHVVTKKNLLPLKLPATMPMEYYINSTELLECCAIKCLSLFKQDRDLPCADVKGEREVMPLTNLPASLEDLFFV
ncbi:hypothetical protein CEXT_195471 [Caerostris extrusa]|uniref:Uncharacterized protein n=1 Tax=Caerostris extrusa TaxID=172846 RepID=A0AAV4NIE6_CAEEX|nr:hypothetical protein CEXT_195471 [Caerostris extrusa]